MSNNNMADVSSWPERPRLAVKEMTAKYGAPLEVARLSIYSEKFQGIIKNLSLDKRIAGLAFRRFHQRR